MGGVITPKAHTIYGIIGEIFKGEYHDLYGFYMLFFSLNIKGFPVPTIHQLRAKLYVES